MKRKSFQISLGRLIVLVACCGVIAWACHLIGESLRPPTAREWLESLRWGTVPERKSAAEILSRADADPVAVIPALVQALGDKDPAVRAQAALSLGHCASRTATVHKTAAAALVRAAAKGLLDTIAKDGEASVRSAAVFSLAAFPAATADAGILPDKSLVPDPIDPVAVAAALNTAMERDPENRLVFIVAFATIGQESMPAPSALVAALGDPSASVRQRGLLALSQFGSGVDGAIPVLIRDAEAEFRQSSSSSSSNQDKSPYFVAARAMSPSTTVIPALVEALASDSRYVRGLAAVLLGRIGPRARPAAPELIAGMRKSIASRQGSIRSGDPLVRDFAPAVARVASLEDALSIFGEALRSESYFARSAAGSVLAKLGPRAHPAVPALVATMKEAKQSEAKPDHGGSGYAFAIAEALGQIAPRAPLNKSASDEVIAALSEGLAFKDSGTRRACVAALANLGPRAAAAVPGLRALVAGSDTQLRADAASALEKIAPRSRPITESIPPARK